MAKSIPFRYADEYYPIYTGRFTFNNHPNPQPKKELLSSQQRAQKEDQ